MDGARVDLSRVALGGLGVNAKTHAEISATFCLVVRCGSFSSIIPDPRQLRSNAASFQKPPHHMMALALKNQGFSASHYVVLVSEPCTSKLQKAVASSLDVCAVGKLPFIEKPKLRDFLLKGVSCPALPHVWQRLRIPLQPANGTARTQSAATATARAPSEV